ncbi:toprim domain-containing protein [Larkinella rosea]|uniref:Uncharacterized protein n=1 Tax=Larkinella rosea TaxID=2025312 RepID=A0A3P1BS40_9BACT|nr:toprim domain-containing protein [Larkinella rosea]RRB03898.1 hypothetical protein EHT25_10205 [Larkinella rosea]
MISLKEIARIKKEISIVAYLQKLGHEPVATGSKFLYRSPLTNERTASFYVDPVANTFADFSYGKVDGYLGGDIIDLVARLNRFSFPQAVAALQADSNKPYFFLIGQNSYSVESETKLEIVAIIHLQHQALLKYLNQRGIPDAYASNYCKEIHFLSKGQKRFGIGFSTNCGSWAIRSEKFKCWIGKGDYTFIEGASSVNANALNLFEGFFDFLSCLVYCKTKQLHNPSLILNSTTHLNRAMEQIQLAPVVNCFLDNDKAGDSAYQKLLEKGVNVIDHRGIYAGYNDFNDFLMRYTNT